MKTYTITARIVGSKYIGEVEAASPQEALDKATDLPGFGASLCHQCCSECEDPEIDGFTAEHRLKDGTYETGHEHGFDESRADEARAALLEIVKTCGPNAGTVETMTLKTLKQRLRHIRELAVDVIGELPK